MKNMRSVMKNPTFLMFAFVLAWPLLVQAEEIFHWVDANGVHHYSQSPPPEKADGVKTLQVDGSQPASYDPTEDRYNVAAQEIAMQERRDKLEESRKSQQQAQQTSTSNTVVYYPQPDAGNAILYPPGYRPIAPGWPNRPRPPHHPDRPGGKPDKPGTLPEETPPNSLPFRPLRARD